MGSSEQAKKEEPKVYPWGILYPYYHAEKMPWPKGFRTTGDVDIIFLAGQTGRDPLTDREPRDFEEQRRGVGTVVGGIKEQTHQALKVIKESLEEMGASLENIVRWHYYVARVEDWWDFRETLYEFFRENCPDLLENRRPSVLQKGVRLDLPNMLCEIEATAVVPRAKS